MHARFHPLRRSRRARCWLRATLVAACLAGTTLSGGCYQPSPAEGLPCSPTGGCPDDQRCGSDDLCHAASQSAPSCADPTGAGCSDAGTGTDATPTPDTHTAIGTLLVTRAGATDKCLASLIAADTLVTRAACVQGADQLALSIGARDVAIDGVAVHPDSTGEPDDPDDVALVFLAQPLALTPLILSDAAPRSGQSYTAVWPMTPDPDAVGNFQVAVTAAAVDPTLFLFTSDLMSSPFSCPSPGGPTLALGPGGHDVIVGIHSRSPCEGAGYVDLRIDAVRAWILDAIAAHQPATCAGFEPATCPDPTGCGTTACDDSSGHAVITCVPGGDDRCPDGQVCDAQAHCTGSQPPPTHECEPNTWRRCGAGDCGWQWCDPDNLVWFPCAGTSNLCADPDTQECVGVAADDFVCESVTCSTSGRSLECSFAPDAIPGSVGAGTGWLTGSGCPAGSCRQCRCSDDNDGDAQGAVTCGGCLQ